MGLVIQYRDYDKPAQRRSDMEEHNRKRVRTFDPPGFVDLTDTAPCEYVAPEQDSA